MFECMWTPGVHIDVCACGDSVWMSGVIFRYSSTLFSEGEPLNQTQRLPQNFLGDSLCSETQRTGWQPHPPNTQVGAGHLNMLLKLMLQALERWALAPALRCLVYKAFLFLCVEPVHLVYFLPHIVASFPLLLIAVPCLCNDAFISEPPLFPGWNSSVFTLARVSTVVCLVVVFSVSMFPLWSQSWGIVCKER